MPKARRKLSPAEQIRLEQVRATREKNQALMRQHLRGARLSSFVEELQFHETRKWAFDFAWPAQMIAVELEGGTWSGGGHVRGEGYEKDCRKYNAAVERGWRILRFTTDMVASGEALNVIERALRA